MRPKSINEGRQSGLATTGNAPHNTLRDLMNLPSLCRLTENDRVFQSNEGAPNAIERQQILLGETLSEVHRWCLRLRDQA